jgi:alpha-1,6-mannosyltransferase
MHLVDITMFYAAEGGGVSTYLNAKAHWLARRSRVQHTIMSSNVETCDDAVPALVKIPVRRPAGLPRLPHAAVRRGAGAPAGIRRPDLVEAGDAGHCAWAALRMRKRYDIPPSPSTTPTSRAWCNRAWAAGSRAAPAATSPTCTASSTSCWRPAASWSQQLDAMGVCGVVHQPLGIDSSVFRPQRRDDTLREHLGLDPDARLLVYAGRFTPEKKLHVLVEAVRKLGDPYHLILVGGGGVLPYCDRAQRTIPFRRDQRQLASLLASCDVLVHPGRLRDLRPDRAGSDGLRPAGRRHEQGRRGRAGRHGDRHPGRAEHVDSLAGAIEAIYQRDLARMGEAASAQGRRALRLERNPAAGAWPLRWIAGRLSACGRQPGHRGDLCQRSVSQTDWSPDEHVLCVSIHDVAPATWSDCLRLVQACAPWPTSR